MYNTVEDSNGEQSMNRIDRLKFAEELSKIAEEMMVAGRPKMTKEEFVERARKVHGDKYDYSRVDMDNRDDKGRVYIICRKCGQGFWQRPDKHLDGNGCMNCYVKESDGQVPGQPQPEQAVPAQQPAQQPAQPAQQKPAPQPKPQPQVAPQPKPQPAPQPAPQPVQKLVQKAPVAPAVKPERRLV